MLIVLSVHFIKTDANPDHFKMLHFLSIKSVYVNLRPEAIYFHSPVEPRGHWWEQIKTYVTFVHAEVAATCALI